MRISVTQIEAYRRYTEGRYSVEQLESQIKRTEELSIYMTLGSSFHKILESKYVYDAINDHYTADGIDWNGDVIRECLKHIQQGTLYEQKLTKKYIVNGEEIIVVAKVDQIKGLQIIENKTCWSSFSFDNYYNSCQWRYYCEIFDALMVQYNVFTFYRNSQDIIIFKSFDKMVTVPYPKMADDNLSLLRDFVEFIKLRNLQEYFEVK